MDKNTPKCIGKNISDIILKGLISKYLPVKVLVWTYIISSWWIFKEMAHYYIVGFLF